MVYECHLSIGLLDIFAAGVSIYPQYFVMVIGGHNSPSMCVLVHYIYSERQSMEMFLDKNGTSLQRRKMYVGFPLNSMKSHLNFDWQNDDPSIQDQMGKRYKINQERKQLTKKYTQQVDNQFRSRYIQLHDDNVADKEKKNARKNEPADILSLQVEQFNKSKVASQAGPISPRQINIPETYQYDKSNDNRFNQSYSHNSPKPQNYELYDPSKNTINYRYQQPYNPEQYSSQRYRSLDLDRYNYELGSSPSKFVEKMYTGSAPMEYPFRNVMPDMLENHLREKLKADHKRKYKVDLNLFNYYTKQ